MGSGLRTGFLMLIPIYGTGSFLFTREFNPDRTLETVSDELHKELAALAAKLGVSVEHLWGVLVRQALDGLSSLVTVFCCAAAGLGVLWFFF